MGGLIDCSNLIRVGFHFLSLSVGRISILKCVSSEMSVKVSIVHFITAHVELKVAFYFGSSSAGRI